MSQLERVYFINRKIKDKGYVTTKEVIDEFEVTNRTVYRDIEYIRDRFQVQIEYSKFKNGFCYMSNIDIEELNFLDEKLLMFYSFLKKLVDTQNYLPFTIDDILQEIKNGIPAEYRDIYKYIEYSYISERANLNIIKVLLECVLKKKQCFIIYNNTEGNRLKRNIEPLRLINNSGIWNVLAYCHLKKSIRTFGLSRIDYIEITDKKYESELNSKDIKDTYGLIKGENVIYVTIRFYGRAYYIVRYQKWHKNQRSEEGDNKRGKYIEFTLPIIFYDEILDKISQYREDVEVIAPDDFRAMWQDGINKMYEHYIK